LRTGVFLKMKELWYNKEKKAASKIIKMTDKEHSNEDPQKREKVRRLSNLAYWASKTGEQIPVENIYEETRVEIETLLKEQPIFYNEEKDVTQRIELEAEISKSMPKEFYDNPTRWIESQPNINRKYEEGYLPQGESIAEFQEMPYDISKVKIVTLPDKKARKVVIKRIDPQEKTEISRARKAYEAGIPTPKILGTIMDQGNTYAIFEHIDGHNLNSLPQERHFMHAPRTITDKLLFQQTLLSSKYWQKLSAQAQKKLEKLWRKYLPDILFKEISLSFIRQAIRKDAYYNREQFLFDDNGYPTEAVQETLKLHGYETLDDVFAAYDQDAQKCENKITRKIKEKTEKILKIFEEDWNEICEKDLFGISLTEETFRLKKLCEQKGIHHKDFANRNLVLSSGKKPKLYLIDWEENIQ